MLDTRLIEKEDLKNPENLKSLRYLKKSSCMHQEANINIFKLYLNRFKLYFSFL
jgi:hypothetical protein